MAIERTFGMVKSAAVGRGAAPAILRMAEEAGLTVAWRELHFRFPRAAAEEIYAAHAGRPYHEGLIDSVTGPEGTMTFALTGESAVSRWRALMGATDPAKAEAGTIRHLHGGTALPDNATHGSDDEAQAAREEAIARRASAAPRPRGRATAPDRWDGRVSMLVVTARHLRAADTALLDSWSKADDREGPMTARTGGGWLLYCDEELRGSPGTLGAIVRAACEMGCEYVMIDGDGGVELAGLPLEEQA